jgi:hypothetical protein
VLTSTAQVADPGRVPSPHAARQIATIYQFRDIDAVTESPLRHLNAVTETRRITFEGSGPFVRTLVTALEDEGVAVAVRREGRYLGQHREPRGMGDPVKATLVATGSIEAIEAGVSAFRQRFASRAVVTIQGETDPPARGRHRA